MKKKSMSQINKIKKQIENYNYKLDNDINKVFMPSFLYSLHELKHYYNNYEIVANLLVDFFQKIKSYEGRMVDNVLDYFLFYQSDLSSLSFEELVIDKLYLLTNNFTNNYYVELFTRALKKCVLYEISNVIYSKDGERVFLHCKLDYRVQVINFREKIWKYAFWLLKYSDRLAREVFNSYIFNNYPDSIDEQFIQNDLVYIKKHLKESDKDNTVLQIFLLNLKYCLQAYGIDFLELGIELNFTARLYFIVNLSCLTLGESATWNSSREMQYNAIKELFQENSNFNDWWNALVEVNKDQIIDDAFILFFEFLMKDMPQKLFWFIEKLLLNDVLQFVKPKFVKAVFDLQLQEEVLPILLNSKVKIATDWLVIHLIYLNQKSKLSAEHKKLLIDIFKNKLNEIEIFYSKEIKILEEDQDLFYEIIKIIIEQIPNEKALSFFHSLELETIDKLLQNLKYTKEQKETLNLAKENKG